MSMTTEDKSLRALFSWDLKEKHATEGKFKIYKHHFVSKHPVAEEETD